MSDDLESRIAALERRSKKKKKFWKKGMLRNIIVIADLLYLVRMSEWAFDMMERGIEPSSTYTVLAGIFGGELLLLMAKHIFYDKKKGEVE